MKFNKNIFLGVIFFGSSLFAYRLEKEEVCSFLQRGEDCNRVDVTNFFHPTSLSFKNEQFVTNPLALQLAAESALRYFKSPRYANSRIIKPWSFDNNILSTNKARKTLEFIISTIKEDNRKKSKHRILDPNFLNKNFKFIKWSGDTSAAYKNKVVIPESLNRGKIPKGNIRLTNYAIFVLNGSYRKNEDFPCALYNIVDKKFAEIDCLKYTKQDVLSGMLNNQENKNKVKPMAWVSRDSLEEVLMQGSALIKMPDNKNRFFNVEKNNGFVYDKKIKDAKEQKRYWYFKEIQDKNFSKTNGVLLNHSGAVFAGDIYNIGLGKIIAIKYKNPLSKCDEVRLGVLADSGGALTNNLYQLDLFMGVFDNKDKFKSRIRNMPNSVEAYILVKS